MGSPVTPEEVAALLREPGLRLAIATHRNPDGDALGSSLGLARALAAHGADVLLWHCDGHAVPPDLAFLLAPGERLTADLPADADTRLLVTLDCASAERVDPQGRHERFARVVNVDHHHDNTRFGDLDLVVGTAASTAEVVVDLLDLAGIPLDRTVAEPLYVGVVTDTGRFGYGATTAGTHRTAAALVRAGSDVAALHRRLYEDHPLSAVRLLGRALERLEMRHENRFARASLRAEDFHHAGTGDADGIVEILRGIRGVEVAAVVRAEATDGGAWRVSLRARDERVDVSAVARTRGGGGHAAAAGCTVHGGLAEVLDWLDDAVAAAL